MSRDQMDPAFAEGLRASLVDQVNASSPARAPRPAWWVGLGAFAGIGLLGGVGAAAAGLFSEPGSDVVTDVQETITATYTGTQLLEVGDAPIGATHIRIDLTCLSPGTVYWPDGGSMVCRTGDEGSSGAGSFPLSPGQASLEIRADDPGMSYEAKTTYENRTQTEWAVNDSGDTYGAANDNGEPDLISVITTDGRRGYVYSDELNEASGMTALDEASGPAEALAWQQARAGTVALIPAYESDGETAIGQFEAGHW